MVRRSTLAFFAAGASSSLSASCFRYFFDAEATDRVTGSLVKHLNLVWFGFPHFRQTEAFFLSSMTELGIPRSSLSLSLKSAFPFPFEGPGCDSGCEGLFLFSFFSFFYILFSHLGVCSEASPEPRDRF